MTDDDMEDLRREVHALTKNSRITLGLGGIILCCAVTMTWFYAENQATLRAEIGQQQAATRETIIGLQRDVLELRKELARSETLWADRLTWTMFASWTKLLATANRNVIEVPDPPPRVSPK